MSGKEPSAKLIINLNIIHIKYMEKVKKVCNLDVLNFKLGGNSKILRKAKT